MIQVPPESASTGTGDYLGQWLAHVRGRVRAKTYEGYEGLVRLYAVPGIGDVELTELRPLHLQSLYASLLTERDPPLSSGTVLNLHLVLTQALGQAVRWELLASNPAAGAQPPRPRRQEFTVIDAPLVARILEAVAGSDLELACAIAIATGMRRGEILALQWSDIDEDYSTAHVRRTLQMTNDGLVFEQPKTRRSRRAVALRRSSVPTSCGSADPRPTGRQSSRTLGMGRVSWSVGVRAHRSTPTPSRRLGLGCWSGPGYRMSGSTICAMRTRR